jgi:hypothetical protein
MENNGYSILFRNGIVNGSILINLDIVNEIMNGNKAVCHDEMVNAH